MKINKNIIKELTEYLNEFMESINYYCPCYLIGRTMSQRLFELTYSNNLLIRTKVVDLWKIWEETSFSQMMTTIRSDTTLDYSIVDFLFIVGTTSGMAGMDRRSVPTGGNRVSRRILSNIRYMIYDL